MIDITTGITKNMIDGTVTETEVREHTKLALRFLNHLAAVLRDTDIVGEEDYDELAPRPVIPDNPMGDLVQDTVSAILLNAREQVSVAGREAADRYHEHLAIERADREYEAAADA